MATSEQYIEFVCEQIRELGTVRYRKMFGEYMIYVNDKPILLVCDNTVYIKKQPEKMPEIAEIMKNSECGIPYKNAKEHYILDIENMSLVKKSVTALDKVIPLPKPKSKRKNKI